VNLFAVASSGMCRSCFWCIVSWCEEEGRWMGESCPLTSQDSRQVE